MAFGDRALHWTETANNLQNTLLDGAWSDKRGAFTAGFGLDDLDASVLLLPDIGLIEPTDPASFRPSLLSNASCYAENT